MNKIHCLGILLLLTVSGCLMANLSDGNKMTIRDFAEWDQRKVDTIIYKKVDGNNLRLLVSKPDGWEKGQKRPAMVWIHGGGWVGGAPDGFIPHMKYSAARGAVGFAIQYRLVKNFSYRDDKKKSDEENRKLQEATERAFIDGPSVKDCVADCADAIRYIRKNADELGIDHKKISVIGDSAGGHLATCLGTIAPPDARANAVINCNGIVDMTFENWYNYIKPGNNRETRGRAVSPLFYVLDPQKKESGFSPCLILHGKRDGTVKEKMAEDYYNALKKAGADTEYILYPGAQHAFIVYGYSATLEEITQSILDLDAFLVKRGLLEGPTSIKMPDYKNTDKVVADIKESFSDRKVLKQDGDFPGFMTIEMKVRPPKKFNGTLFEMSGRFGCRYNINNGGHDFTASRLRQRGKQIIFKPEEWQEVIISMGPDKVKIKVGNQETEIPNDFKHAYISDEIIINDKLNAEIKDMKVIGCAK